jgi:PBP1b-binding outer membrane lipoprotein LpoB
MKKSIFYGFPAVLVLAALLSGCSQPTDSNDTPSTPSVSVPASDLSYIAYAFGDGVKTVKAVNNISLGSSELVIPAGKTLDLATSKVYIQDITGDSKIIAQGKNAIIFEAQQAKNGGLDFTKAPNTAKIIADRDFINEYA